MLILILLLLWCIYLLLRKEKPKNDVSDLHSTTPNSFSTSTVEPNTTYQPFKSPKRSVKAKVQASPPIGDIFKAQKNKELATRVAELESLLTPEMKNLDNLNREISRKQNAYLDIETALIQKQSELQMLETKLRSTEAEIEAARDRLVETNEEILVQSFGLYTPKFSFANSTQYKERLVSVRAAQKSMIKNGTAATGTTNWAVDGDRKKGAKMVSDITKLLLRAFNSECDDVIEHVRLSNLDASQKRITTSAETISKLGSVMNISINKEYLNLKIEEMYLAYEFQVEKQNERERQKQIRAEERERAKLEREIAEARRKIEKEQQHYTNAYNSLLAQISKASPEEQAELEVKKDELTAKLQELDKSMADVDYREANQRAGYVYVISNIGAFGENVYKIGMTRRLDPMDRIDELGDASVPFNFDVHAMIFSEDAPSLEAALHQAFADRKLNMINTRREFFNVTIDEIEAVVKANYDKTVEFTRVAEAAQYRESLLLKQNA